MEHSKIMLNYEKEFMDVYDNTSKEILQIEGICLDSLSVRKMSECHFAEKFLSDMSIDDNANLNESRSYGNYISEITKGWLKLEGYYELFLQLKELVGVKRAQKTLSDVWEGKMYVHDSTAIQVPYCWAYSTSFILFQGSRWGQLHSMRAKFRKSFIDQVKEVTIEIAQEIAGAVAIGDLFVNYSYFVKKDGLDVSNASDRKDIENDFQSLVHTLNKKLRPSHQSPFTNLSVFDLPNLEYLFKDIRFPDGSSPDFEVIFEIQKIFCDWFCKGDPTSGLPYRFPVVTLNIRIDKDRNIIDQKSFKYFSKINQLNGCFNIYTSSGNKVASCCRLVNDFELAGCDSFGNGGLSLGSHRIVTINLARLGHVSKSKEDLLARLDDILLDSKDILVAHRKLLKKRVDQGFLRFFKLGIMSLERLFSTFGINGIYECLEEMDMSIMTESGKEFAHQILERIKEYSFECRRETGTPFNVEQVPAESLAAKFAHKDNLLFGMDYSLYANQFVPLWVDYDIVDKIKLDGEFSKVLTGGGISHLNIGERLTSVEQMEKIIKYAIKCGCEHFAVNYNFCKCVNDHVSVTPPSQACPICGDKIEEQYTRIIGYLTPISSWNKSRRTEHSKRKFRGVEDKFEIVINPTNGLPQRVPAQLQR